MTITVTASVEFIEPPRVLLTVTSSPSVTDSLKVWRVHEDGSRYRVLTVDNAVIIGSWAGFDYHAPFNQVVTYFAEAGGQTSPASSSAFVSADRSWLIAPSGPELSVQTTLIGPASEITLKSRSQLFQVLGRRLPVQRHDAPRAGRSGSLQTWFATVDVDAALALLGDGGPVLLNTVYTSPGDPSWMWIQPGDVSVSAPSKRLRDATRFVTFPFEEVTQPDADLHADWTYEDVRDTFINYENARDAYADYQKMKLDVRS